MRKKLKLGEFFADDGRMGGIWIEEVDMPMLACDVCHSNISPILKTKLEKDGYFGVICFKCLSQAFAEAETYLILNRRPFTIKEATWEGERRLSFIIKKFAAKGSGSKCYICKKHKSPMFAHHTDHNESFALICQDCIEEGFGLFECQK